jgi:hypothetical protein
MRDHQAPRFRSNEARPRPPRGTSQGGFPSRLRHEIVLSPSMASVGPILQALEASALERQAHMHAQQEVLSIEVHRVHDEEEDAAAARDTAVESLLCRERTLSNQSSIENDAASCTSQSTNEQLEGSADYNTARCPSTPPTNSSSGIARKRTPDEACPDSQTKRARHRGAEELDGATH